MTSKIGDFTTRSKPIDARDKRDFLSLEDIDAGELEQLFARATELKAARRSGLATPSLAGKSLGMIFEKSSTRTRVSFEVGMFELGGHAVYLPPRGSQLARGESVADTARVLSGYCHGLLIRTFGHDRAEELARHASVPVINALTDARHPCQLLADLFTVHESRGDITQLRYAWVGDGNNMANSWIAAAGLCGLDLRLACPAGFEPDQATLDTARSRVEQRGTGRIEVVSEPAAAVADADVVSTDVWASMGQEEQAQARRQAFVGFMVDRQLLGGASSDSMVLHCLPAHRGEEISAEVIDAPDSAVWRQAENRLHMQKALLELLLG